MSGTAPRAVISGHVPSPDADRVVDPGDLDGWRPRLVATDLDGTLLSSDGVVTPRTRAALEACWDAGIPVVGVTGRGPRLLDSVHAALAGRGIAVLAQGGFVVDLERDEVLRTVGLPRDQAAAVIARIEEVTGDLGTSAARKYDIEAWFPSQGTYRELTSTSDCTTFQARRLAIRHRDEDGRPQTAATLNGTLCAIARTIACLLEVHQRADGSVHVPAVLRPWLGGVEAITPGMALSAPIAPPAA